MRKHAVGVLIHNRWEETHATLRSIYMSKQDKATFDLFLIDNGSNDENRYHLKEFLKSGLLRNHKTILLPYMNISKAWNIFLTQTAAYQYRTVMDNDVIIKGTEPKVHRKPRALYTTSLDGSGSNPGAVKNATFVRGVGDFTASQKYRDTGSNGSRFLDTLQEFMKAYDVDLAALLPASTFFPAELKSAAAAQWNGQSYLRGGCVMISKKCLDLLGYFDERLERMIDIEYSQRAMRMGINIGYHSSDFVFHIGNGKNADTEDVSAARKQKAAQYMQIPNTFRVSSVWEKLTQKIAEQLERTDLLTLNM